MEQENPADAAWTSGTEVSSACASITDNSEIILTIRLDLK